MRLFVLVLFFEAAFVASAATFSSNPTADAFVTTGPSGNLLTNNYGNAGSLSVTAPGMTQGEFQSVLQFNLGAARNAFDTTFGPGQWSLQAVSLQLSAAPANNPMFNAPAAGSFGISWMQNDSWTEGTGSPAAPGTSGITFSSLHGVFVGPGDENLGTFAFNGATSGAFTWSLALTPGMTTDVLAGDNLSLRLFAADGSMSGVFNSRNFGTAANRPLLTVVAVPEPGSMTLTGLGMVFFATWKLARKKRHG
jgi:hypothetical protein